MTSHETLVALLADHLAARRLGHPLRVGIDGYCGAGKSTLARDLAAAITGRGRSVVLLDSDGFHHPRAVRHRQGRDSARGYYEDAYDLAAVRDRVLLPLGPGGSLTYAASIHDLATDEPRERTASAPADAVVLFDCTFLQRGDLRDHWDEVIYLDVDRAVALQRGVARDAAALGGEAAARAAYASRYLAACDLYLVEERPRERASIVVGYDDPARPLVRRGLAGDA